MRERIGITGICWAERQPATAEAPVGVAPVAQLAFLSVTSRQRHQLHSCAVGVAPVAQSRQ